MTDHAAWIGTTERRTDLITPAPIQLLAATFDEPAPATETGHPIPPMWHWLYFHPNSPRSELGEDGHPKRGGFFPPVQQRRRMFAGGSSQFLTPITIGDLVERSAEIISIEEKKGRSGPLVFIKARYRISIPSGLAVQEQQTIVYTDAPPGAISPEDGTPPEAQWHREVPTDPAFLFRFSALTFNAHRIHYDAHYATGVEGYPNLVVHGPIIALLLLGLATSNGNHDVTEFSFQARSPMYVGNSLHLRGNPTDTGADLAAYTSDGQLRMTATVTAKQ